MKAGSDLVFQMHYTANGKAATDRSRVGIVFAKQPPKERVVNTFVYNPSIHIPAGEANFKEVAKVKLYEDVKLQSMFPHMHVRGKAFEYRATYPTGESRGAAERAALRFQLAAHLRFGRADHAAQRHGARSGGAGTTIRPTIRRIRTPSLRSGGAIRPGKKCWPGSWISRFPSRWTRC